MDISDTPHADDLSGELARSLMTTQARLDGLISMLTSIVWTTSPDGRMIEFQSSWARYTGQDWEQQRGLGWEEAIHPDDRAEIHLAWESAIAQRSRFSARGRLWSVEHQAYRRHHAQAVPLIDDGGQIREWIATCLDIEERSQIEDASRTAERRKNEFIAVLAHELRNPLAPIRNAAHIIGSRGHSDPRIVWAHDVIERQLKQMSRLLEDLLDASRISRNKLELRRARVALESIVEAAVETSAPAIEASSHRLSVKLPPVPVFLDGDPLRLAQVFSNLLNNAAKYMDKGGAIRLSATMTPGHVVITVADHGIGMEPSDLAALFQLFSQPGAGRSRSQGGLGVGLSLARGLVELHGGTITAQSGGLGKGSRFTVTLPVSAPESESRHSLAEAGESRQPVRLRVLVADDNSDSADTLAALIEASGHVAQAVYDGEAAARIAESFKPDVAILDIGMPRLDGVQAGIKIRTVLPDVVLMAATGWGQVQDLAATRQAGFQRHMVKPIDPSDLASALSELAVRRLTSFACAPS